MSKYTLLLILVWTSCFGQQDTLYVDGRFIYSTANEKIVLRGFNEMFVWSDDKTGERLIPEIAQSGANTVRLVWSHRYGHKDELVALIENTIAHKMIAMPECHNATGKWEADLRACLRFWKDPILIEGIQRNRNWTLLNIANEIGNKKTSDKKILKVYKRAIKSLRT